MNKTVIALILFFILISLLIYYFNNNKEGAAPNGSPDGATSNSPGGTKSNSPGIKAPVSTSGSLDTSSALTKFANALSYAFSPPAAPSTSFVGAEPPWVTATTNTDYQSHTGSTQCTTNKEQIALDPLPIDQQTNTLLTQHSSNVNNIIANIENKLKSIEDLIENPENILSLNTNFKSVINSGVPIVTTNYDSNSNTILNLTLVAGKVGSNGSPGDSIRGRGVIGKLGKRGDEGVNPLNVQPTQLPYWAR